MHELYYATGNHDKFSTVGRYLAGERPEIILKQCAHELIEIQSDELEQVAIDKARQAWNILQKPVLVDDAGIYFDNYNKFPGVMTKYVFNGIGFEGLYALTKPGDTAYFRLYMVYWYEPQKYIVFESSCAGYISHQTLYKATESSPYNQLFIPNGCDKTLAQMICENGHCQEYDYRIAAVKKFLNWYGK